MSSTGYPSTATLTDHIAKLGIDDMDAKHDASASHEQTHFMAPAAPLSVFQHSRVPSASSASSALLSDSSSAPGRPRRSPMRGGRPTGDVTALLREVDDLQADVSDLLLKIYEIEELRHTPSSGGSQASRLDELLSELNDAINALAPRMASYDASATTPPDPSDVFTSLRADWAKVLAQHALLKQELLEDPWLIRFRVTADQAEGMMDPLQTSLQEVTSYVGRILSSFNPVPMNAPEGRLSIARLRAMAEGHGRLRATYVSSVNKILRIMNKSVADRAAKNGEALRRVNDLASRWGNLQKQLKQLDDKVTLVLSQNDPDHPHFGQSMEMLDDDDESFPASPPYSPPAHHQFDSQHSLALQRVRSAGSAPSTALVSPRTPRIPSVSNGSRGPGSTSGSMGLAPPPTLPRMGSTTPNAGRTIRRAQSRPALASDRPRWNVSTKPDMPPTPSISTRRPSISASVGGYVTPHKARAQSPAFSSPAAASTTSRIPRGTPRKSMPNAPYTPVGSKSAPRPSLPQSRPSLGGSLNRVPPSSFRVVSPASTSNMPRRPATSMSVGSIGSTQIAAMGLRMFQPSKYDQLDLEVQKIIDAVQPNIFIARLDQPIRRGQRRADGETWTGEFVFGVGERSTSVKFIELAGRSAPGHYDDPKRRKVMIKIGGAWQDLGTHLRRKRDEAASMDHDDF